MPPEVENVITALAEVEQAHVVALPDERMGEVGCAFVVVHDAATVTADEVLEHCRGRLARFKIPAHVFFCAASDLPLTASGKVQKFVLAQRAKQLTGGVGAVRTACS
jgi:fatty-acyl-CoA synthase